MNTYISQISFIPSRIPSPEDEISRKVVDALCSTKDLLDQPLVRTALQNIIQINPSELMSILGIRLNFDPPSNSKP